MSHLMAQPVYGWKRGFVSNGKKVLVSGASSGIGRATALRFATEGWDVCLTALPGEALDAALGSALQLHPNGAHFSFGGDYSDPATAEGLGKLIGERWGQLDALVSCAGVYRAADAITSSMDDWRKSFDTMVNGALYLTRMATPLLSNGGRIIHVTSIHGEHAEVGSSGYSMAKAALNQYCRALALELAPRGILVNAIAPGFVETAMSMVDGVSELQSENFRRNYVQGHHLPLKRAAQPEEIAGVAWFLAGPDSSYLTGQVLTVDGGLTITF
jgi:NAD(P)-dependent dehydrogenase (short-subunit alcohol dehydrogenase family)